MGSVSSRNLNDAKIHPLARKNTIRELADYLNDHIMVIPTDLLKVPSKSTAFTRGGSGSGNLSKLYKESIGSRLKNSSATTKASSMLIKRHSTRIIPEEVVKSYLNMIEANAEKPRRSSLRNPFTMQSNLLNSVGHINAGEPATGSSYPYTHMNEMQRAATLSNSKS